MIYDQYFESMRKTATTDIRPYVDGEDLSHLTTELKGDPVDGGKIARNPKDHSDQWYITPESFKQNYE